MVDALDAFSAGEPVHGYKPSAQAAPVVATKTVKLASLPTILVLHLMRFEFGRTGSAKVRKQSCWWTCFFHCITLPWYLWPALLLHEGAVELLALDLFAALLFFTLVAVGQQASFIRRQSYD